MKEQLTIEHMVVITTVIVTTTIVMRFIMDLVKHIQKSIEFHILMTKLEDYQDYLEWQIKRILHK